MARQVLIEKWNSAQEVRLSTALDLELSDTTVYRLGRLVITSVRLHDVGLVGGKEPVNVASEAPSETEASSLSVELASLGLPTAFGKKGSGRREGRRTPGGSLQSSRLAHKGERQSGSRKVSLGGAHDSSDAADSHTSTPWLQGFDEQWGCHYYYNTKTQESVWEAPAEGFLPWEEAAGVANGTDAAQEDVAEPFQPLQLTPDSGAGAGAAGSTVLTGTGACCITGAERDAATAAAVPPEGATEPRAPGPAPRMLTEEDLLQEMGLWQDRGGVQGDRGIRSQTASAAASAPPPAVVRSMGAGGGAANESFGAGAGAGVLPQSSAAGTAAGGNCLGAGLLVNLLLRTSASQQQLSSTSMASTPQQRVVPPTALSEEQLLARLSLSTSPLTPMPPPPAAPAPPPPSPPPPSAVADTDSVSGAVASAASSDARPAAKAPPRMLTEEDILRSMGLLPGSPELGGDQTAANEPRPASASAPAPAPPPGPKPRPPPPPPGFSPAQGPAAMPGHDGCHNACDFEGFQPPPLPQQSQLHNGDRPPPYPLRLQSNQECHPHAGQQAVQYNPGAHPGAPDSGASPRVHPPGGPHSVGPHPQSLYGHNMSHPPHLHGAPGEFHIPGLPQPLPFNHGSAAGVPHMGFRPSPPPPPPGFGHPPPFLPPPVDMWPHPGGPYGPPLMPVMPPAPTSPPPPGFHLSPAGPGMSYGPLPYPYAGHPYPLYGMPPYGMPPGHPAPPPLPPPFAIGGYPPGPAPQPSGAGMALNGGLAPPQHHHAPQSQSVSHHHHHGHDLKDQQQQQQEPEQHLTHRNEQQQRLPSKSPVCVDADMAGSGQPGAEKGPDVNRRTVTWTLEELERQFEIMVATMTAAEDVVPAMATQAKQRQEAREGTEPGLKWPGPADDRQRLQKVRKDKALPAAQQQHVGRHPGAAAGGRRTGTGRSTGGTTEASSADNDDDSAFYDTFVNGAVTAGTAAMAGTAAHIYQRLGTAAKPLVAEDDGTRRVALDPRTAAFVRTLLPRSAAKYWMQRYSLFSRFDSAVRLDTEGWWSVTPEVLAAHQAERSKEMCARGLVAVDACCGCGGNLIQMAGFFPVVLGVEISPKRVEMARHNAGVYGVEHKCQFLCADFFQVAAGLKVDSLFMSPPWGGPKYQHVNTFDVFFPLVGFNKSLLRLLDVTLNCVREQDGVVVAFLPRNTDLQQLAAVVPEHAVWEVERAYVNNKLKGITLYCHPGCTPDEPNVRMEAEAEYSLQGPAQVEVTITAG